MSLSQSTLTSPFKRSAPETHHADDTVLAMMFIPKRKKNEDNKKKYEMKHIRKFQPATKYTAPLVGSILN